MFGGDGSYAARARTLADAVRDLNLRVQQGLGLLKSGRLVFDGGSVTAFNGLAQALRELTAELRVTNAHLSTIARSPILRTFGGDAERELQRIVSEADHVIRAVDEVLRHAHA